MTRTPLLSLAAAAVPVAAVAWYLQRQRALRRRLPKLTWLDLELCVVRFSAEEVNWPATPAADSQFFSATRTSDETSLILESRHAPTASEGAGFEVEDGWAIFKLEGPLDFALIGILSRIASALAARGISIFAVSTYDTDYVLLKESERHEATLVLQRAGYVFEGLEQQPRTQLQGNDMMAVAVGMVAAAAGIALSTRASASSGTVGEHQQQLLTACIAASAICAATVSTCCACVLVSRRRHVEALSAQLNGQRVRIAQMGTELAALEQERSVMRTALDELNRMQRDLDLYEPPLPRDLVPTAGWTRCMQATGAIDEGYAKWSAKASRQKTTLISHFDDERPPPRKAEVDRLLAAHVRRVFPCLAEMLAATPTLVLLLLDAPGCGTTAALLHEMPELADHAPRICIAQADPAHYARQIRRCGGDDDAEGDAAGGSGGSSAGSSPLSRSLASSLARLNVRCQRMDQWLSSNRRAGLRVCVCFADYETSIYGKQRANFAPLRDLALFFRLGFCHEKLLLGVTLAFRTPHESRYADDAPQLGVDDLTGFVAAEARAAGMTRCELVETVRYGLTFCLFELSVM